MYLIALCDDDTAELNKTEEMLKHYKDRHPEVDFMVDYFKNAEELLDMVKKKNYMPDLVLLDMYLPGRMGIEAARELRDMENKSRIVFLTMSREHALEAFGVNAAQYLVKPISETVLFPVLDRFLEEIEKERQRYLLLRITGRIQRVALDDIVFCEAQGKKQCLHLIDGTQCILHTTMAEIYGMLSCYQEFIRVGIAYIVNLGHIDSLNAKDICLNTGKKIHLPRGAYKMLKEQYLRYYCEED